MSARRPSPPGTVTPPTVRATVGLVRAAHIGPALAVTCLAGLLAAAQGLDTGRGALVVAAVLSGQLSVGWSNDLIDLRRDREVQRRDKPLVAGEVSVRAVAVGCALAVLACVALSAWCGLVPGSVNLASVALAWAYNAGLKATLASWVPYAVSFACLPAFVSLVDGELPPWWWPTGAALLGVGAHLLNALPDLEADAATGVRGLPHALGAPRIAPLAAAVLLVGSAVVLVGSSPGVAVVLTAGAAILALAVVVVRGTGRRPFVSAIGIALVDAALLVVAR